MGHQQVGGGNGLLRLVDSWIGCRVFKKEKWKASENKTNFLFKVKYQERWTLEIDCFFDCDFAVCLASDVRVSYKVGQQIEIKNKNRIKKEK